MRLVAAIGFDDSPRRFRKFHEHDSRPVAVIKHPIHHARFFAVAVFVEAGHFLLKFARTALPQRVFFADEVEVVNHFREPHFEL